MRLTIRAKITGLCCLLLIGAILTLSHFFSLSSARSRAAWARHLTAVTAGLLAEKMRSRVETLGTEARRWALLAQNARDPLAKELESEGVLGLWIFEETEAGGYRLRDRFLSRALLGRSSSDGITPEKVGEEIAWLRASGEKFRAVPSGQDLVLMGPISGERKTFFAVLVPQARVVDTLPNDGLVSSFLVTGEGDLFATSGKSGTTREAAIDEFMEGDAGEEEVSYSDVENGSRWWASFQYVGFGELAAGAVSSESDVLLLTKALRRREWYATLAVLAVSLAIAMLYSLTLTGPLRQCVAAVQRITQGDFRVRLRPHTADELAELANAVNAMARGLEDREQVRSAFSRLHDRKVVSHLLSEELKLGGELREALILFSDVRDFTRLTESVPPEEVVGTLNEFFSRMVPIIGSHGGIVDKFLGDGLLAYWGFPRFSDGDADRAMAACLALREELGVMNGLRQARGQALLRFGIGVSAGKVVFGNIGSPERMEYTLIGDAVNVASRLESLTKVLRTDVLVAKSVFEKASARYVFELCPGIKVKGKVAPVEAYKLIGAQEARATG